MSPDVSISCMYSCLVIHSSSKLSPPIQERRVS